MSEHNNTTGKPVEPTTLTLNDEEAAELAQLCPRHKIIIDCCWGIPAIADSIKAGSLAIGQLAEPYRNMIQNDPDLKAEATKYALEGHEIEKELFAINRRIAQLALKFAKAIAASSDYDEGGHEYL